MRVKTNQERSFADQFINIPDTELDMLDKLIDWDSLSNHLVKIEGDYSAISLFKILGAVLDN